MNLTFGSKWLIHPLATLTLVGSHTVKGNEAAAPVLS
ncbi:hypothetical protein ABIE78_000241 [Sinorhizobium fredii]